eukprot:jgi/Botrbrau1/16051/Bobra.7_2s0025.1
MAANAIPSSSSQNCPPADSLSDLNDWGQHMGGQYVPRDGAPAYKYCLCLNAAAMRAELSWDVNKPYMWSGHLQFAIRVWSNFTQSACPCLGGFLKHSGRDIPDGGLGV